MKLKRKCTGWAIVTTVERPDGTWYVTDDGQEWKQEEDGSFHRMK